MESLIEKAKKNTVKMFTKISDNINRNRWDKSQINTALFEDSDTKQNENVSDFEKQVKEYKSNLDANKTLEDTIIEKTNVVEPHEETIIREVEGHEIEIAKKCYYVHITRTKEYPNPGSEVVIRSCDSERAWTSNELKSTYPSYKYCPECGLPIEWLSSEIDT